MKIKYCGFNLNVEILGKNDSMAQIPVIFLHGFTGAGSEWYSTVKKLPENFYAVLPDIIGHGNSDSPEEQKYYNTEELVNQLRHLITQLKLEKPVIAGYSMGGRLTISYAVNYPDTITALFLESTTPGIIDLSEREKRITSDQKLAELINAKTKAEFFKFWYSQPMFKSFLARVKDFNTFVRLKTYNKTGLSNILRGFGTGKMDNWWNDVHLLSNLPVRIIVGEKDDKFRDTGIRLGKELPNSEFSIVEGAGHNIHIEFNDYFTKLLNNFLLNIC